MSFMQALESELKGLREVGYSASRASGVVQGVKTALMMMEMMQFTPAMPQQVGERYEEMVKSLMTNQLVAALITLMDEGISPSTPSDEAAAEAARCSEIVEKIYENLSDALDREVLDEVQTEYPLQ